MKTNEKLYGVGVEVPPIPAKTANARIILLNENLHKLTSVHFMEQDNDTIREVQIAIGFWQKLRDGEDI